MIADAVEARRRAEAERDDALATQSAQLAAITTYRDERDRQVHDLEFKMEQKTRELTATQVDLQLLRSFYP